MFDMLSAFIGAGVYSIFYSIFRRRSWQNITFYLIIYMTPKF
jgi:hypothetical protein